MFKRIERWKMIMDFFEARAEQRKFRHIAEEIEKEAIQTDCPVYKGDKEIDLYVKLSDVIKILEDNSPMEFPLLDKHYSSNSDEPCCRCDSRKTNADRIRNMSDEELAEFLVGFKNTFGEEYEGEVSCMGWLQSEAE